MKIEGDEAKGFRAVRLDSYDNVNLGTLTFADEETGEVRWIDKAEKSVAKTLGPRAIKILGNYR